MVSRNKAELIVKWSKRGYEVPEISRLLRIGEDECRSVLTHPELAEPDRRPKPDAYPEFIEPLFE